MRGSILLHPCRNWTRWCHIRGHFIFWQKLKQKKPWLVDQIFNLFFSSTIPNHQPIAFNHFWFDENYFSESIEAWKYLRQAARRERKQDFGHGLALYTQRTQGLVKSARIPHSDDQHVDQPWWLLRHGRFLGGKHINKEGNKQLQPIWHARFVRKCT